MFLLDLKQSLLFRTYSADIVLFRFQIYVACFGRVTVLRYKCQFHFWIGNCHKLFGWGLDDDDLIWGMGKIFHFCHILSDSCTCSAIYPVGDGRLSIHRVKLTPRFQY